MEIPRHLDLVREELAELVDALPPLDPPDAPFGLYALPSRDTAAELARHVERRVFWEYFRNSPRQLAEEYGPYEEASLFLCVVDRRRRLPAGAMRLILPSPAGFKSLKDIETVWGQPLDTVLTRTGLDLDETRVWDVATLAVDAGYRSRTTDGLVSLALYQGLGLASRYADVRWLVAVLDVVVLDLIQAVAAQPFSLFAGVGPLSYLGSPSSVPVWCDIEAWERRVREADPAVHDLFRHESSLAPAIAQPDWSSVAALVRSMSGLGAPTSTGD